MIRTLEFKAWSSQTIDLTKLYFLVLALVGYGKEQGNEEDELSPIEISSA